MADLELSLTQQTIIALKQALADGTYVEIRRLLDELPPGDAAHVLESTPPAERALLWQFIDAEDQGDVLEELSEDVRDQILSTMEPSVLAAAAEAMDVDDAAYVLRGLPDDVYREVLAQMDAENRERVEQAMQFDEDCAGSLMSTDIITVRADVAVEVVLRYLRMRGEIPDNTDKVFITDDDGEYLGHISLQTLLVSPPEEMLSEHMDSRLVPLKVTDDADTVASRFDRQNLISAPVVDEQNRLVGRITIDDVVDVIREQSEHTMMGLSGLDDDEDTFAPVIKSAKKRTIWLAANLVTALMAATVSSMFEDTLATLATVAVLMTIVPSMGGIAGNQTLALVIRGMALGHIGESNRRWLINKEALVGLLNGILWAAMITVVVAIWKGSWPLGIVIGGAMLINLTVAGLAGVLIPLGMKKAGIDPALAGGMALTTITDVVGLSAFLGMSTLMIHHFNL